MRKPDWENRLAEYLISVRERSHVYGKHDCMLFVAGAVRAVTGRDHARGHRGKYKTAKGAARYLKRLRFSSPAEMIGSKLKPKAIGFVQRGDVVAGADGIPGIAMGEYALVIGEADGAQGLVRLPMAEWREAWSV